MNRFFLNVLIVLLTATAPAFAAISIRGGYIIPAGSFDDISNDGYSLDALATFTYLRIPFVSMVAMINGVELSEKATATEKSKISIRGGGLGVRLQPSPPILRPFGEVILRLSSIEQDYLPQPTGERKVETTTKFGLQLNAGIQYSIAPTLSLELGGSYQLYSDRNFRFQAKTKNIAPALYGVFIGINMGIGR